MALLLRTDVNREFDELFAAVSHAHRYSLGFPAADDLQVPPLGRWSRQMLNNIGDPGDERRARAHTKRLERQVIAAVAQLMRAPDTRWGYVATGSTEGTGHALYEARRAYPDVVAYASAAAHYSVGKWCDLLRIPLVTIAAEGGGGLDVLDLREQLGQHRDRAAVVVATVGTTMTEALDDVPGIVSALDAAQITRRRLHVDAALAGVPLALLPAAERPAFDFSVPGVTSLVVSGHKFLSTLVPCAVLLYRGTPWPMPNGAVSYISSADTTIVGSRSGHTPLVLWYLLHAVGLDEHAERARAARAEALYVQQQLRLLGVDARRHEHAMTVWFPDLPTWVMDKYDLPSSNGYGHVITMPGRARAVLDEFLADVRLAVEAGRTMSGAGRLP